MSRPSPGRLRWAAAGFAVAATVAVAASFLLPWARSGRAVRSGFALARTVDVLGLADAPPLRALLVGVWSTPMLAGLAWTAAALGRGRVAGALAVLAGALGVAAGCVVLVSGGVTAEIGCWAGMVAGVAGLAGGTWAATTTARRV